MLRRSTLTLVALLTLTQTALAAPSSKYSITPTFGGYLFDGAQNLDHSPVMGLRLGYAASERCAVEALAESIVANSDPGTTRVNLYRFGLDGLYAFPMGQRLVPFAAVGLSALDGDNSDAKGLFSWGGGIKYLLAGEVAALRLDVRHNVLLDSDHYSNLEYGIGLQIPFCTGSAAPVGNDSDRDGVVDPLDLCPNTKAGQGVDGNGCPPLTKEAYTVKLQIVFDTGKSDISESYAGDLKRTADFMKAYPKARLTVEGHTDNQGSEEMNQPLSQQRAAAVRSYLVDKLGVAGERVTAAGYGSSRPVADNATAEGRQQNRRIDAVFTAGE